MPENKDTVSKMEHQTALMHYNWANRRMLIAVISVCLTFIIVVMINTIRETRWQDTVKDLQQQMMQAITVMQNGTQQNGNSQGP